LLTLLALVRGSFLPGEIGAIHDEDNHVLKASKTTPRLRPGGDYSDACSRNRCPS